jgi:3-hydroxyisobutyrate dehydrogenase-like beta-hydroxyacid dehydrogenase
MGLPMVTRLRAADFDVVAYDVVAGARERAKGSGATIVDQLTDIGPVDLVLSSLPDTPDVASAYAAPGGIFDLVARGTVCADLSTCAVAGSRSIAEIAADKGLVFLDAPVSGTSIHAEAGTLVIMVGGDPAGLERARPALDTFSSAVHHVGGNGDGLALKLITNRLLTTHLAGIAEAILDMEAMGLDVESGIDIISQGAVARLLEYKAGPIARRDYSPLFTVDLMKKDLRLAADVLPAEQLSALSQSLIEQASDRGMGSDDVVAITAILESATDQQP